MRYRVPRPHQYISGDVSSASDSGEERGPQLLSCLPSASERVRMERQHPPQPPWHSCAPCRPACLATTRVAPSTSERRICISVWYLSGVQHGPSISEYQCHHRTSATMSAAPLSTRAPESIVQTTPAHAVAASVTATPDSRARSADRKCTTRDRHCEKTTALRQVERTLLHPGQDADARICALNETGLSGIQQLNVGLVLPLREKSPSVDHPTSSVRH